MDKLSSLFVPRVGDEEKKKVLYYRNLVQDRIEAKGSPVLNVIKLFWFVTYTLAQSASVFVYK